MCRIVLASVSVFVIVAVSQAALPTCDNGNPEFDPFCSTGPSPVEETDSIAWVFCESIPVPLTRTAGVVDPEGKIRVICGNTMLNDTSYKYQQIYDPLTNTWTVDTTLAHPGGGVHNHDVEIIGDSIYVGWGSLKAGYYDYLTRIDLVAGTWTVVGAAPVAQLLYYEMVACNGKLYLFGGAPAGGTATNAARVYDPLTNQWSSLANIPVAVRDPAACAVGDTIYLFGGFTSGTNGIPNCYAYNTVTNTWRTLANLPRPRGWATAHAITHPDSGTFIYVCGGESAGVARNLVHRYSVATNTWTAEMPMQRAKRSHAGAVIEPCSLYTLTGYAGARPFLGAVERGLVYGWTGLEDKQSLPVPGPRLPTTVVRGSFTLAPRTACRANLITPDGRNVMLLRPGRNDLSQLAPGIYFVRPEPAAARQVSRLVLLH
ncbi:MAG: kelch repeat-containing protein [candidate division WOR-3 bacterium]